MPVEIREIIIKTEIAPAGRSPQPTLKEKDIQALRRQVLEECRRLIAESSREKSYKR